jgi:hypothetical protein
MIKKDIRLNYYPRDWQKQCHINRQRFTVLALHRRAGKTELALMELLNEALKFDKELGFFVYVSPYLKQSRAIAWARLKQKIEPLRIVGAVDISEVDGSVTFKHNGAVIRIFGADNPDALRGMRLDGVVLDEVAQIKPEIWNDVLQPALSDRKGWAMFIGTPSGINLFSELYFKASELEGWYGARYTVYDTHAIDEDEVERLRRDMSETSFAREYLCDFSAAGDNQLISLSDAEAAAKRVYTIDDISFAPKIIGVDPARFGDDRSVIFKRQGLQAYPPLVFRGMNNMDLASRIATEIYDWQPDAVFIDSGAGAGVIDRLRQLNHDVVEVAFGGRATKEKQFINKRSEMWIEMAEWIKEGGSIPDNPILKQEISTPVYWYDAAGKRCLESKDDIKKRLQGGGSPDLADALALTFAHNVTPKPRTAIERLATKSISDREYDPLNY